jgi:hypothetical protein
MTPKRIATGVTLALLGIIAAVAIGLLANTISGDSVGLSAEPLSAGDTLAPPASERRRVAARGGGKTPSSAASAHRGGEGGRPGLSAGHRSASGTPAGRR